MPPLLDRRHLLAGGGALVLSGGASAQAKPIYIADMHYHLFFLGKRSAQSQPLGPNMARGRATLVAWTLVGDQPWLKPGAGGFKQSGAPQQGQARAWLHEEMARVKAHIASQGLAIVTSPKDVASALDGKPHVVLAVEGATFADDGIAEVEAAHKLGVRHIQLVHFIANKVGDMQTEPASHGGLTELGRRVIETCNRLGILIDLAHCTDRAVQQALEVSKAPVVWSHSSLEGWRASFPYAPAFARRQLPASTAQKIAAKGGVVGLWALGADVGTTVESYTDRILELADRLGERHIAFGTDMNALANPALSSFADLRAVVELMAKRGRSEAMIRRIAIENYADILTRATSGGT